MPPFGAAFAKRLADGVPTRMKLQRRKLPSGKRRGELLAALARQQVLVVTGETGCRAGYAPQRV